MSPRTKATPFARLALLASLLAPAAALAGEIAVTVENRSEPTLCAEVDNVHLAFSAPDVAGLRIEAVHPAYIGALAVDSTAPDWTDCDMSADPAFPAEPRTVRIDVADDMWLVGIVYPSFWRPADVPLFADGERVDGLHLVQLFVERDGIAEEVLVVYPPDGYWRARPMTPRGFDPGPGAPEGHGTAYGSSFLVGPVTDEGRPVVALESLAFVPERPGFDLSFAAGGTARLSIASVDRDALAIDVAFEGIPDDLPFAALRSMYVTAVNNDAAAVAWRAPGAAGWGEAPVMDFDRAAADRFWLGRVVPSRHNTSAPDHVLGPFREAGGAD